MKAVVQPPREYPQDEIVRLEVELSRLERLYCEERKERRRLERALAMCYVLSRHRHRYAFFDRTLRLRDVASLVRRVLRWPGEPPIGEVLRDESLT